MHYALAQYLQYWASLSPGVSVRCVFRGDRRRSRSFDPIDGTVSRSSVSRGLGGPLGVRRGVGGLLLDGLEVGVSEENPVSVPASFDQEDGEGRKEIGVRQHFNGVCSYSLPLQHNFFLDLR